MRARAATTSCIASGSMLRMSSPAELDAHSGADAEALGGDVRCRREILDREAERFEQCDVLIVSPTLAAPDEQLADLGDDVLGADVAIMQGDENVAGLFEGGFASVDVQPRFDDSGGVELAGARLAGTDCVHVRSRREPLAIQHGGARGCG